MQTSKHINYALRHMGESGFSGYPISGKSAKSALMTYLSHLDLPADAIHKTIRGLIRQNLVEVSGKAPDFRVTLTPAGAYRLTESLLDTYSIANPKKWDGHWHVVSYDMPASKKSERYQLVKHLKRLNLYQLQGSIWAHPYACEETVRSIADTLGIARYLTLMEIVTLDPATQKRLLSHFGSIGVAL